jgi:hypothetical protein
MPTRKNQALVLVTQTCLDPFTLVTRTLGTHTQVLGLLYCGPRYKAITLPSYIRHVRSISINIRSMRGMVSCFVVLLHLVRVGFGELDELFAIVVHP